MFGYWRKMYMEILRVQGQTLSRALKAEGELGDVRRENSTLRAQTFPLRVDGYELRQTMFEASMKLREWQEKLGDGAMPGSCTSLDPPNGYNPLTKEQKP